MKKRTEKVLHHAELNDLKARLAAARANERQMAQERDQLRRELGHALEVRDLLRDAARAMPAPKIPVLPPRGKRPAAALLVLFGDLHIGEWTDPQQCGGWGRYNVAIAERRTAEYITVLRRYLWVQRHGYDIREAFVVLLGDMIAGDIQEELKRTNEISPPQQATKAGRLVATLVSALATECTRITVEGVGGSNHGRLTPKYQFKGGTLNNMDLVTYEMAEALLQNHSTVSMKIHRTLRPIVTIAGHKFLCGHGHHIKAWMGIPHYGLTRDRARQAERHMRRMRAGEDAGFDYVLGGHWHTPFVGEDFRTLNNGSLSGTNEYDDAAARHSPPQQVSALVSPKHGLFGPVAWQLDTSDEVALLEKRA